MKPKRLTTISLLAAASVLGAGNLGPATGTRFPAFKLPDQNGQIHSLRSLLGSKGAVILFNPSPDKAQLFELQQHEGAFHKLGLGVAVVSRNSVAALKELASHSSIRIPLLSDSAAKNSGWFVLDAKGVLVAKYSEEDSSEYYTSAAVLLHQFGWTPAEAPREIKGKLLTATIGASNATVEPGQRVALTLDVDLQPNMHVYAPGVEDTYIPIEWKMEDSNSAQAHAPELPHAEKLFLKAINETVPAYTSHFRLTRDITIPPADKLKAALDRSGRLVVASSLHYQACDDRMCYFPQSLPLQWTFEVPTLDK
jgi:peroxiredoxin